MCLNEVRTEYLPGHVWAEGRQPDPGLRGPGLPRPQHLLAVRDGGGGDDLPAQRRPGHLHPDAGRARGQHGHRVGADPGPGAGLQRGVSLHRREHPGQAGGRAVINNKSFVQGKVHARAVVGVYRKEF